MAWPLGLVLCTISGYRGCHRTTETQDSDFGKPSRTQIVTRCVKTLERPCSSGAVRRRVEAGPQALSGTLYVFCASQMSARLEVAIARYIEPIAHVTWTKPNEPGYDGWKGKMNKMALRTWYPHSERILVFEQGTYGTSEAYRRSPMGQYLRDRRHESGLTMVALTELVGRTARSTGAAPLRTGRRAATCRRPTSTPS